MTAIKLPLNDREFLITGNNSYTLKQAASIAKSIGEELISMGVHTGERVGIYAKNSDFYVLTLLALWQQGCTAVPLNIRWPIGAIDASLEMIQCTKVITDHKELAISGTVFEFNKIPAALYSIDNITLVPDREAVLVFTSGSTGQPKAASFDLPSHYYNALGSGQNIQFLKGDRWLLSLPLFHVGGLSTIFKSLIGGAMVIPETRDIIEAIDSTHITHISLVGTQLFRLIQNKHNIKTMQKLKAILLGGSAISPALIAQAQKLNLPIFTSYGCTEMGSQITCTIPDDSAEHLLTSGKLLTYRQIDITPENEIRVKGSVLFKGYVTTSGLDQPFTNDGWYITGDAGYLNADGYLVVTGRKDNMFISGGENIHPEEIEQALLQIPGIEETIVVPLPHQEFGARPAAFIKTDTEDFNETKIREQLLTLLPKFKIPDKFFPWPRDESSLGIKPDRKHMKNLALQLSLIVE